MIFFLNKFQKRFFSSSEIDRKTYFMGREKKTNAFGSHFFGGTELLEEQVVILFGKNGATSHQKNLIRNYQKLSEMIRKTFIRNHRAKRYEGVARLDVHMSLNLRSNTDLAWDGDRPG